MNLRRNDGPETLKLHESKRSAVGCASSFQINVANPAVLKKKQLHFSKPQLPSSAPCRTNLRFLVLSHHRADFPRKAAQDARSLETSCQQSCLLYPVSLFAGPNVPGIPKKTSCVPHGDLFFSICEKMTSTFTSEEQCWIDKLRSVEYNQCHLLDGADSEGTKRLISQIKALNASYPGGLLNYIQRARKLLIDSRDGVNAFDGCTPSVPAGEKLVTGTAEFSKFEKLGLANLDKLAFVLVAGGLGERLGYPDIKIGLPIETVTGMTYIEYYVRMILSCEKYAEKQNGIRPRLPLAIMTSEDTHDRTLRLLKANSCFGLPEDQLTVMKQQKVATLMDNDASLSTCSSDRYSIEMKPHGHGDVHTLLDQHGLPMKWRQDGKEWMLIFQDTNGLVSHAVCPMLGVSVQNNFVMNSLTIPRLPGEAVGAICRLEKSDSSHLTVNVEYNQLSPLLIATGQGKDTADPITGFSPFPGNANVLMFNLPRYSEVLKSTGGTVPEFVNPKYKDDTKTVFKAPTRLECLMQEFPRLFSPEDKVMCFVQMLFLMFFYRLG